MGATTGSYGIVYTASSVASSPDTTRPQLSPKLLEELGIQWVRVYWLDYANVLRFQFLSRSYFSHLLGNPRPGILLGSANLAAVHLNVLEDRRLGVNGYAFDASSFRICPYAPGHASIFGFFEDSVPSPSPGPAPVPFCPRGLLHRLVEDARVKAGVEFIVGFETEFTFLRSALPIVTQDVPGDYCTASTYRVTDPETKALLAIGENLQLAGVGVEKLHSEAGPGQYEIITTPLTPLAAADALVVTREVLYNVAELHGLKATLAPRLFNFTLGTGMHVHISIHNIQGAQKPSGSDEHLAPTLTPTERSFLQGLVSHLPAMCALTLPTPPSYGRVADHIWSCGTVAAWGTDNRDAAVRLTGSKGSHHFEVRSADGTASPYLTVAAIIAAGTLGITQQAPLVVGDCPIAAVALPEEQKKQLNMLNPQKLPLSLEEARNFLNADEELKGALGKEFVEQYMQVNKLLETSLTAGDEQAQLKELLSLY